MTTVLQHSEDQTLRENIMVKLPHNTYNSYISPDKFHSDMVMPNSKIAEIPVSNQNTTSINNENYNFTTTSNELYSTLVTKSANVTLTFNNIKTYEDHRARVTSVMDVDGKAQVFMCNPAGAAAPVPILPYYPSIANFDWQGTDVSTSETGNANPFQAPCFGLCTDFLNASIITNSVTIGSNGRSIQYTVFTPKQMDVERRKLNKDFLRDNYDGLLYPDLCLNRQYSIPFKKTHCIVKPSGAAAAVATSFTFLTNKTTYESALPTFNDLENDKNNALSRQKRGQVFNQRQKTEVPMYKFSKSIATRNYIFDSAAGTFTQTATDTKDLEAFRVGNYWFPSNVVGAQTLFYDGLLSFYDLCFFTNKLSPLATTVEAANVLTHTIGAEPSNQTLTVELTLSLKSPVFNPLLSVDDVASFSRTEKFGLEITKGSNFNQLISSNFKFNQEFINYQDNTSNNISVSIRQYDCTIYLMQYTNELLSPYISNTVVLPFLNTLLVQNTPQRVVFTPQTANTTVKKTYLFQSIKVGGDIPRYVQIFLDRPGCVITDLKVQVNSGTNVMVNRTIQNLYRCTKLNGMEVYSERDFDGYGNTYDKTDYSVGSFNSINYGTGSILFLRFGEDIPLNNPQLLSGLGGVDMTITYEVTVEIPGLNQVFEGNVVCYLTHFTQSYYSIENSAATVANSIYTLSDVATAYKKIISQITNKTMYVNVRRFVGGSVVGTYSKMRSILPKIYSVAKTANEIRGDLTGPTRELVTAGKHFSEGVRSANSRFGNLIREM